VCIPIPECGRFSGGWSPSQRLITAFPQFKR
jgi:hypothetical protein